RLPSLGKPGRMLRAGLGIQRRSAAEAGRRRRDDQRHQAVPAGGKPSAATGCDDGFQGHTVAERAGVSRSQSHRLQHLRHQHAWREPRRDGDSDLRDRRQVSLADAMVTAETQPGLRDTILAAAAGYELSEQERVAECLGAGLPPEAEAHLRLAGQHYHQDEVALAHLQSAWELAPGHAAVYIGQYRFHFYKNRLAEALRIGKACLVKAA